jgi:hypothetical protein
MIKLQDPNHRTTVVLTLVTLLLAGLTGCAGDPGDKPVWVSASDVDIPALETFGWEGPADAAPVTILDNQIRDALRAQLEAKGYSETIEDPDFLISHETIEHDALKKGNPVRIGVGVGSWGGNVGGSVGTSVDVGEKDKMVQQLKLQVHAVDPDRGREIWAGTSAVLPERPDSAAVNRAVVDLMVGFPTKAADPTP